MQYLRTEVVLLYSNEPRLSQQVQQLDPDLLATCTKIQKHCFRIPRLSRNFPGFSGPTPFPGLEFWTITFKDFPGSVRTLNICQTKKNMKSQIYQHISESETITVAHSFGTSLLYRNHIMIWICPSLIYITWFRHYWQGQGDKCECQKINQYASTSSVNDYCDGSVTCGECRIIH